MSQNPPLPQQSTSPHPQHKGFSITRTVLALIGTMLISAVFTACSDPELDEDFVGDNDARLHEYFNEEQIPNPPGLGTSNRVVSVDDLDAEIAAEIARHDAVLARNGFPALGARERCQIAARHRQQNATEVCAATPSP